jgi:hypothetical protein
MSRVRCPQSLPVATPFPSDQPRVDALGGTKPNNLYGRAELDVPILRIPFPSALFFLFTKRTPMETLLAEQPLVSSLLLAMLGSAMIFGWMQTGRRGPLVAGLLTLLLIPGAFVLASYWVTDRELITAAIYRTADAVSNNDIDRAIEVIEPSRREQVASARADLQRFRFDEARVNKLRTIDLLDNSVPPKAEVDMSVTVVVSDKRGQITQQTVPRRVILQFQKSTSGEWLVHDYNHMPIIGSPDAFSPKP